MNKPNLKSQLKTHRFERKRMRELGINQAKSKSKSKFSKNLSVGTFSKSSHFPNTHMAVSEHQLSKFKLSQIVVNEAKNNIKKMSIISTPTISNQKIKSKKAKKRSLSRSSSQYKLRHPHYQISSQMESKPLR